MLGFHRTDFFHYILGLPYKKQLKILARKHLVGAIILDLDYFYTWKKLWEILSRLVRLKITYCLQ